MIKVSNQTIIAAFRVLESHARYSRWLRTFPGTLGLYASAEKAFSARNGNIKCFQPIYDSLRGQSQAFRGVETHWDARKIYSELMHLDGDLRVLSLSRVEAEHWPRVWGSVSAMRQIKETRNGPSLVALSKFLHFWNPRLFVIFDAAVMEGYVCRHMWLACELSQDDRVRELCRVPKRENDGFERLVTYMRFLMFASGFAQRNPHVVTAFAQMARRQAGNTEFANSVNDYEAVAVEWCLQGLVELCPAGVKTQGSRKKSGP
jgi:hypothetical protein